MIINDLIYGEFKIEKILEDLINTEALQRLKKIHQGGASYLVNPKWNVTRYEHSVGTMLLIRFLGGSVEEQIAGLLHDISHTAFSHVVDFALDNKDEDYHEEIYSKIVEESDIPLILNKNGYDYKDILYNESKWSILEKSAPKLCADRIDYTLRDMYQYNVISLEEVKEFLKNIIIVNGEIVIKSVKIAEWFVEVYYKEVIGFFMNPLNVYGYDRLSKAIKRALQLNEISLNDLMKDDEYIYEVLEKSKDKEIKGFIEGLKCNVKEDKENFHIHQKNKVRIIDPTILEGGELHTASTKSEIVKTYNKEALKQSMEGVFLRVL